MDPKGKRTLRDVIELQSNQLSNGYIHGFLRLMRIPRSFVINDLLIKQHTKCAISIRQTRVKL